MRPWRARRAYGIALAGAVALGVTMLGAPTSSAAGDATVYLVQGLPGKTLTIAVDGKTGVKNQKSGVISDPIKVASGKRRVTVTSAGKAIIDQTVSIGPNWSADVVVHLPADPNGKPLLTTYH